MSVVEKLNNWWLSFILDIKIPLTTTQKFSWNVGILLVSFIVGAIALLEALITDNNWVYIYSVFITGSLFPLIFMQIGAIAFKVLLMKTQLQAAAVIVDNPSTRPRRTMQLAEEINREE